MNKIALNWLEVSDMKILKQIIIISDRNNGETELGSIVYTRQFTENYNLVKQKEEDDRENDPMKKLLFEYPKQNNYPNDRLDEIILASVKKNFPKSIVRNDTILFNVDLKKIAILKNRIVNKSVIYFSPEFSKIANYYRYTDYAGTTVQIPQLDINIYSYYGPESFCEQNFHADYHTTEQHLLEELKNVVFE